MKKLDQQDKIYLLLALFIGALLAANFLGAKITAFAVPAALAIFLNAIFWPIIFVVNLAASPLPDYQIINNPFLAYNFFNTIHVSVGILTVPVMFLITDIIEEVMGKKTAQKLIIDLKSKLDNSSADLAVLNQDSGLVEGLVSLGFAKHEIQKIAPKIKPNLDLAIQIKLALKLLNK